MNDRPNSSEAVLEELMAGNARYVDGCMQSSNPPTARDALASGQAPMAAMIRCADSRVAPEIVFDQPLGSLFVCGVAGNIPTPEIIASLEYAIAVLDTTLIVVMGHSSCGAVSAALEHRGDSNALPGGLPALVDQIIDPCTADADPASPGALDAAIACNARQGIGAIMEGSDLIAAAVEAGGVRIVAGVQDLASGHFHLLSDD